MTVYGTHFAQSVPTQWSALVNPSNRDGRTGHMDPEKLSGLMHDNLGS